MAGHMPHWARKKQHARRARDIRRQRERLDALHLLGGTSPAERQARERTAQHIHMMIEGFRTRPVM